MNFNIRILDEKDLESYKSIRLELLTEAPENFGSSYEEESLFKDEQWLDRLCKPTAMTIGAFLDEKIIGICVILKNPRKKIKHVASLHSLYVKKKYRNQGIAKNLFVFSEKVLSAEGIKHLRLSVVTTNIAAYNLYRSLGFVTYGEEPKAINYDGVYFNLFLMNKDL
jgi:ribosomal protein S18 acetylase RimI-like enzyme